jgi:hypothetical protein
MRPDTDLAYTLRSGKSTLHIFRTLISSYKEHPLITNYRANIVFLLTVVSLAFWYRRCNKKADRGELIIAGIEGFRYTI